ncbi:MAG: glycosyltransferase family 2 protein [Trueperaceae bacterium]|nr:glycosyltransferase family 2 protein [Trueperaceae bacterium]
MFFTSLPILLLIGYCVPFLISHFSLFKLNLPKSLPTAFKHFVSVDSAPKAFTVKRPAWLPALFFISFTALCLLIGIYFETLQTFYLNIMTTFFGQGALEENFGLKLRPFFFAFFLSFSLFASGKLLDRLRLAAMLLGYYGALTLSTDLLSFSHRLSFFPSPSSLALTLINGGFAFALFAAILMLHVRLPQHAPLATRFTLTPGPILRLSIAATLAGLGSYYVQTYFTAELNQLREWGLLGGLGPGIVLFVPFLNIILVLLGVLRLRKKRRSVNIPVAVIIPAYNEEKHIASCIYSLDRAAAHYGSKVTLYLIDNNSKDNTYRVASQALADCRYLKGKVHICEEPGKSKALNYALSLTTEAVIIRVDADTLVSQDVIRNSVSYFADKKVGAVGGIPLPKGKARLLNNMRTIEVLLGHGFTKIGFSALNALLSVPGIFAVYRRDLLVALGGFVEGMNGEDTDITLRIGRLGYKVISDPGLKVYSEVPETWEHLREQRLRWFRSAFHVSARNLSAIVRLEGLRGIFAMPWVLFQTSRRSMLLPLLIYGISLYYFQPDALLSHGLSTLLALVVGSSAVVTLFVLLIYKKTQLVLYLPAYLIFRLVRSYLTFEMLFTLPLKDLQAEVIQNWKYVRELKARRSLNGW